MRRISAGALAIAVAMMWLTANTTADQQPAGASTAKPAVTAAAKAAPQAAQPGASVAEVARRYGIDRRVLCRWKQELAAPVFVAVQITDAGAPVGTAPSAERPVS